MWFPHLVGEDLLEEEMATHSILAWVISCTEGLAGHRPWSCKELNRT